MLKFLSKHILYFDSPNVSVLLDDTPFSPSTPYSDVQARDFGFVPLKNTPLY